MKFKIVSLVVALALILAVGAAYATPLGACWFKWPRPENHQGNGYGHYKHKNFGPD